jgi:uncharacterized membrane protein YccC
MLTAMTLNHTAKESIKTALAMTIAYSIGLSMGWDRPYWAGFAVAFCSLATIGQSFNKGTLRMVGTVIAAFVALTVISLTAQQRWVFITCVSLWCGLCTYMMAGSKNQYFWHVSGFVFVIICMDGGPYPDNAFATAMLRLQQTALGLGVYSLVALLLWPNSSRAGMEAAALELVDTQLKLFRASLQLATDASQGEAAHALYTKEMAGGNQFGALLDAAEIDTDEVREVKDLWRQYQAATTALAEAMQRWRENAADLQRIPLQQLLPGLEGFAAAVEQRLGAVRRVLNNEQAGPVPDADALDVDTDTLQGLSHFSRAALMVAREHLLQIDKLSLQMFSTAQSIRADDKLPASVDSPLPTGSTGFVPDPDRLLAAVQVMSTLWLAFLAVVYIADFPGGMGFVTMCSPIAMALLTNPQMPISITYIPAAVGIGIGAILYILVMPQLASFWGLGAMIFAATFVICYRYASPQQGLGRAFGLAMMLTLIAVSNEQSYNFLSVANTALMFPLLFLLLTIMTYLPYSPRPERALLRLLKRYFHSAAYLLSQPATAQATRWRHAFHRQEITAVPAKLNAWAGHVDPAVLGAASVQQLPALLASLQALSLRQQELMEARALPQSSLLEAALTDDMQAWRRRVIDALERLADDPSQGRTLARAGLDQRLQQLEKKIAQTMNENPEQGLTAPERENFYRLLGAYRGTSEALLDFAGLAATVDWQPCYEERFA